MDSEAFRQYGKEMVDFVADYWESLPQRRPVPNIRPGFIWDMVPSEAPVEPEDWSKIFADLEPIVLQPNTNWHHPNFFAYYPTSCSYAAIIGDILSGGLASIGFTWKSGPSMTELEMAMTDWLAKAIGLPEEFLNSHVGPGAGIIQSTASDATLVALLSARARATRLAKEVEKRSMENGTGTSQLHSFFSKTLSKLNIKESSLFKNLLSASNDQVNSDSNIAAMPKPVTFDVHDSAYFERLVAYCSDQAHSSVDKGVMLSGVKLRKLRTTRDSKFNNFSVLPEELETAIKKDRSNGLIPFILIITVGTTNTCGAESIRKMANICNRENIWIHVDAAYAGSFLLCDEFRYLSDGVEFVDSFNFNAHKSMMVNFDCSPMWFKNATEAIAYFNVDPLYLKHEHKDAYDYRHLQVALGRRFRSLKIWFVLRAIGIKRIQEWLRMQVKLASYFAQLISNDPKFELFVSPHLGLVCFRLKGDDQLNEKLNMAINEDGRIHLVAASTHGVYFLRLAICSMKTTTKNVDEAYKVIREIAENILTNNT